MSFFGARERLFDVCVFFQNLVPLTALFKFAEVGELSRHLYRLGVDANRFTSSHTI